MVAVPAALYVEVVLRIVSDGIAGQASPDNGAVGSHLADLDAGCLTSGRGDDGEQSRPRRGCSGDQGGDDEFATVE